jgi:CHAT domain-containing protein
MSSPLPKEKSATALLLADPAYDLLAGPGKGEGGASPGEAVRRAGLHFKPLSGFTREADAVGRLLEGRAGWQVRRLLGEAASEEALALVNRPRLVYCATHGFFLSDVERPPEQFERLRDLELVTTGPLRLRLPHFGEDPRLRSGLALAGANKWQERSQKGQSDGLLTALEGENLDLWGTELVVLSACETGLGQVQVGEGVLGLRRAFQLAGARTVLASLWKVPDAETEQLMTAFLTRWLKGEAPAEALRAAQRELIRALRASPSAARRQAPPLYWASFICHGSPR